jgi:hypothetical protein
MLSPPLENWLPPLKSTVSFLLRTDGRSKGSGVSSGMAAVAAGRCTSQFVGTPICYVNRGLHATVAGEFSGLDCLTNMFLAGGLRQWIGYLVGS